MGVGSPEKAKVVLAEVVPEMVVDFIFPDVGCVVHLPLSLLLSCALQPCCPIDGSNFAPHKKHT